MTLGERIKKKRKENKLTQKALAGILGIDHTTVSKWESNIYEPDTKTLNKLAELLSVSTDYLIGTKYPYRIDYSIMLNNPRVLNDAIKYFINLLFNNQLPISSSIESEVFDAVSKEIENYKIEIKDTINILNTSIKKEEQLSNIICSVSNVMFKVDLLEALQKIAIKYYLWFDEASTLENRDIKDLKKILLKDQLTYDGKKISEQQIKLIQNFLEVMFKDE